MANIIEESKSSRATCRSCRQKIEKGTLRFGEEIPFMECDDAGEYKKVREQFYPSLLRLEARGKRAP